MQKGLPHLQDEEEEYADNQEGDYVEVSRAPPGVHKKDDADEYSSVDEEEEDEEEEDEDEDYADIPESGAGDDDTDKEDEATAELDWTLVKTYRGRRGDKRRRNLVTNLVKGDLIARYVFKSHKPNYAVKSAAERILLFTYFE